MIPRTLPPVHSPISLSALWRGWTSFGGHGDSAVSAVHRLVREWFGSREILLTDSGTSALALALKFAVASRPGRSLVGLPAWACYDLATAADAAGAGVVLYDLDPQTLGPDWTSFDRALSAEVAAVVVVHAYGIPVNLTEVTRRARAANILVIEDAAQAIGATIGGKRAGAVGDLGVLSFGRGKGWTGGGGGALLLNSDEPDLFLPRPETLLPSGGGGGSVAKLTAQWMLARPSLYAIPSALPFLKLGQTIYHPPHPPANLGTAEAQVLLRTAPLQDREAELRRRNAGRLGRAVTDAGAGKIPAGWDGGVASWLRLPVLPGDAMLQRSHSQEAIRLGILPAYPTPLSRLPGFDRVRAGDGPFPGAEELAQRLRTLPTHGGLSHSDLTRLERWLATS